MEKLNLGFKGILYELDDNGNPVREWHNRFVIAGRYFAMESLFPVERTGNTWWDEMSNSETRYFGCGTNTTADGVTGPTSGVPIANDGTWQGASLYDWKLGEEMVSGVSRGTLTIVSRINRTITVEFTITGGTHCTAATDVNEIGIFLGNDQAYPEYGPDNGWNTNDRINAMIVRIILYTDNGSQYVVDPINLASSETKTYRYVFQDI